MKRFSALSLVVVLAACGGGEPAEDTAGEPAAAAPARPAGATMGDMVMTDWFHVDDANRSVHMTITAGLTDVKNYWNFNGGSDGDMTITVPEGYAVVLDFVNNDPAMAHSVGIHEMAANWGIVQPDPVFEGAISSNPASMTEATMPGQSETLSFTASTAGEYAMVCYIPGHTAAGMWIRFNVSSDGSKGVQTAM